MKQKIKSWIKKINPCEAAEDSFIWRLMSTLFPDCFCCAGLRGIFIGAGLSLLVYGVGRIW